MRTVQVLREQMRTSLAAECSGIRGACGTPLPPRGRSNQELEFEDADRPLSAQAIIPFHCSRA